MKSLLVGTLVPVIGASVLLGGCGGGGDDAAGPAPPPSPAGLLRQVTGPAELEASIKQGFTAVRTSQSFGATVGSGFGATSVEAYSRTYTQDTDVDEFDSVRYDGEYLFVAPLRGHFPCCFISTDPLVGEFPPPPPAERSIRILATDPATAGLTEVSEIPLGENVSVQGLYRSDNRLVALTSESFFGPFGDPWASLAIWTQEQSGLAVYDTTDIAQPEKVFDATFDGFFIDSRRVGDIVYVVSRYTPSVEGLNYHVTTAAEGAANAAILDGVTLADLLPRITVNGQENSLVTPQNCFIPSAETPEYPVITSITAIPIGNPAAFTTTCYNDDAYGVHVSSAALYLAQSRSGGKRTRLHKFAFGGSAPAYAGSADIDGIVWTGGQADFRLSEHDGDLRALATQFEPGTGDTVDHFLYVLRESASGNALEVVSRLPNANRPEEIGKPNETLYGVRFIGNRAYAVTFEQIDPLYVIDLSDPTDPRIAGTLEVSGFSDFLHPVGDDLLLGLGTSENNAIKLELFDVSNIAEPRSRGSDILGGRGSFSEARWDRHAFTYLAGLDGTDRFAIPADLTQNDDSYLLVESGLYLYEIRDKATPALSSLERVGAVLIRDENGTGPASPSVRSRAVLHDDAIWYVRDDEVYSSMWTTPELVSGPF